ncbi:MULTISPECIES: glycoside hydrolase family 9 protein [Emticicia]|uniref:glycoside hydrolase family 9 protein n=1 Tax=Emticicia TaxID=312278 RepID=UPI0007D8B30C|nr:MULTISPECIES: glycoside hydrolase family 9 protein [Emticicia]
MKFCKTFFLILALPFLVSAQTYIRVNQLGYLPKAVKVAVVLSKHQKPLQSFTIKDAITDKVVFSSNKIKNHGAFGNFTSTYRLDFSNFQKKGAYYIQTNDSKSIKFRIDEEVYAGSADFLLKYMRQQRCGYNPFLKDSCHIHDGFRVYHPDPKKDSTHIDVKGGWHDASDYLQYTTTSANAIYQMLLAYKNNPTVFKDFHQANGLEGSNGIPDIIDEIKWGIDWLVKMNPAYGEMYNQIADDRDHIGLRLPNNDPNSYGKGTMRPVYFCTGKPQGAFQNKSRATGIASTAGKYASTFALGSEVLQKFYPDFSKTLKKKAIDAYDWGKKNPGACQTAPCRAPYFYEEDNWTDDMELAAAELSKITKNKDYLQDAINFSKQETVTPWMINDTARHYQWYPFMNAGHYQTASQMTNNNELKSYYQQGLSAIEARAKKNPFLNGIPFIWCSNNLVTATLTQINLYRKLGGKGFEEMEAALRDWLFGCNPWGTSMIVGLPLAGDYPQDPHSAFTYLKNYPIDGGLVDGPVRTSIFKGLKYVALRFPDEYADFQSNMAVYHDDFGDYSTNEPTMDGTACLTYYLSTLENASKTTEKLSIYKGAITRFDANKKIIRLAFTGHEFYEGGEKIAQTLKSENIKGSFFFTGEFYRNPATYSLIQKLISDGHYLGGHSDKHLLYNDWTKPDSLLISKLQFDDDLKSNYLAMSKFGITPEKAPYFMPPFEWYNETIAEWTKNNGLQLINFTAGTGSNRDYTYPEIGNKYANNQTIMRDILKYEKNNKDGLNGFILLIHLGTDPRRKEKFYDQLSKLIKHLKQKGYQFKRL